MNDGVVRGLRKLREVGRRGEKEKGTTRGRGREE